MYSWKDQVSEIRPAEQSEKAEELPGEFMEWNTVEWAIKTETDTKTEWKGVGKFGWFMSKTQIATSPPREGKSAGTLACDGGENLANHSSSEIFYSILFVTEDQLVSTSSTLIFQRISPTVAQRTETTVDERFQMNCAWSLFPTPSLPGQLESTHSDLFFSSWTRGLR